MSKNYSIKFPLEFAIDSVGYQAETDFKETVKYNLKSTLLTCPGECLSKPDFGVCLRQIIFEQPKPNLINSLKFRIAKQIKDYMPYLTLLQNLVWVPRDSHVLYIRLKYSISQSGAIDTFETSIDLSGI